LCSRIMSKPYKRKLHSILAPALSIVVWSAVALLLAATVTLQGCGGSTSTTPAKGVGSKAFVLLGSTGDNAYRPAGFWTGLFESWCTGIFEQDPKVDIHIQINQGHTIEEIHGKVMATLTPFYETLQADQSWKCKRPATNSFSGKPDCGLETFFNACRKNIWAGIGRYNASGQAANMSYLAKYDEVISYMNLPPAAYAQWSGPMVQHWGGGQKMQIAVEKPFGGGRDSLEDATALHKSIIDSGLPQSNLHLTDHWLSFFMNKNLGAFRKIVAPLLGIEFSGKDIEKIVVTEYEERGFGGRGAFIDDLGQVRDMVQSHLLQVLALTMIEPDTASLAAAKLNIFNSLSLDKCENWQFDGLLESKKLKYHPSFADATNSRVSVKSSMTDWKDVELVIQTGKAMDINLYTIEIYQRGGKGVLTYNIGKEEVGIGDIRVSNWPLKDSSPFFAPLPGFESGATRQFVPSVSPSGDGYILRYNDPDLYFPKSYAFICTALIKADYQAAFVTWPECERCWTVITDKSPAVCLDPPPENVKVYTPGFLCDKTAPDICDQHETVQDKYTMKYACTLEHDVWYKDVDLYQAKCHPKPKELTMDIFF